MAEPTATDDGTLLERLRARDEAAFVALVDRYGSTMLRVARAYVATHEAAEDVVQETFLGVLRGLDGFEGRSSLRTWIFRILVNRAQTRGEREKRSSPFSSLVAADEPTVDPDRFEQQGRWTGFWRTPPAHDAMPEARVLAGELGDRVRAAVDALPAAQRTVLELRDVHGFSTEEVCELLGLTEGNQRVLLHRGRARVRELLEAYVDSRRL